MALHIALTGGIACGKSMAERCFAEAGCRVLDADQVVRELEAPGGAAVEAIVQHFGETVRARDGGIDRVALASIVFNDKSARQALESILYPMLKNVIAQWLSKEKPEDISLFSAALLFECDWAKDWPHVVCVVASEATQLRRMMQHRQMSESDAHARLSAQMPIAEKASLADAIIYNDVDDINPLKEQIQQLVSQWRKNAQSFNH
ncbi:MAG: dephospho-CoA kinase [bacterium]|nr:dephospho-CoA kinase [bacterium]